MATVGATGTSAMPAWLIGGIIGFIVGVAVTRFAAGSFGRLRARCRARSAATMAGGRTSPEHLIRNAASIFEALTHPVIAVHPDGTILEANGALVALFGYASSVRVRAQVCTGVCPCARLTGAVCACWCLCARACAPLVLLSGCLRRTVCGWLVSAPLIEMAQDDLVGRQIGVIMPSHTVKPHTGYMREFGATGIVHPAIRGKMLHVMLRCADSSMIPCQMAITKAGIARENIVVASIMDLRPVRLLEQARNACHRHTLYSICICARVLEISLTREHTRSKSRRSTRPRCGWRSHGMRTR
jgi:hypothetical protein